jgi:hypothetical protein
MAVKANISAIRSIIRTNDKIRDIAFGDVSLRTEEIQQLLINISQDIPELTDWRVYHHCAVVTRLYAIYETFVEDLIEDWLILLPSLYSNYSELNEEYNRYPLDDWFYEPQWQQKNLEGKQWSDNQNYLVFISDQGLKLNIIGQLQTKGSIFFVKTGDVYLSSG